MPRVSLMDVHSTLSHLVFAVQEVIKPINAMVTATWHPSVYLRIDVECRERDKQRVVDQLKHGAITGEYDYRFSVSYPTGGTDPNAWVVIHAYPDMSHDDRQFAKDAA